MEGGSSCLFGCQISELLNLRKSEILEDKCFLYLLWTMNYQLTNNVCKFVAFPRIYLTPYLFITFSVCCLVPLSWVLILSLYLALSISLSRTLYISLSLSLYLSLATSLWSHYCMKHIPQNNKRSIILETL